MSAFNIFLLVFVAVAAVWGFISGIVRQAGSIAALVAAIIACRFFGPRAVDWLSHAAAQPQPSVTITALAYVALFILAYFAVWLLAVLLQRLLAGLSLGLFDRLAGAVFKVALWLLALSIALNAWTALFPDKTPGGEWAAAVEKIAPAVIGMARANQ